MKACSAKQGERTMANTQTRSAIVTGASRGIGSVVAKRLAHDGFAIVVNYAGNAAKAEEVVAEIKAAGGQAVAVQADVANAADVEQLFKQTLDTYGRVDVVVNNAGIMPLSPIAKGDVATFDKVITTNLRGTFLVWDRRLSMFQKAAASSPSQAAFWQKHSRPTARTSLPRLALRGWSTF